MLDVNGKIRIVSGNTELYQDGATNLAIRSGAVDGVGIFTDYGLSLPITGKAYNLVLSKSLRLGDGEADPIISYGSGALIFQNDITERARITAGGD